MSTLGVGQNIASEEGALAQSLRLYAGTDQGVSVWRPNGASWEETGRLDLGRAVRTMRGSPIHPERVFMGVFSDGLYRTRDAGVHWTKVFTHDHVRAVAIDPSDDDVVYLGTEPIQLYLSEDGGDHWEELSALQGLPDEVKKRWWAPGEPHLGHVRDIFIQPLDPRTIYLSLEHGGIVRTFDRGASWEDVTAGIDYVDIHMVSSTPGRADRYFTATARGFFATDDAAEGWERAETGFTRDYFHDFVFLPPQQDGGDPTMLVATADKSPGSWRRPDGARGAVFRSLDCARSWHQVGEGLPDSMRENVWAIALNPNDRNGAFIGLGQAFSEGTDDSEGILMATSDRGDSWQPLELRLPPVRALWTTGE